MNKTLEATKTAIINLKGSLPAHLKLLDTVVPTSERQVIEYIDEHGDSQVKSITPQLFLRMLEIAEERFTAISNMHWITTPTVYDFAQNALTLENYGAQKVKYLCAILFGCDRKLSLFITIFSAILENGLINIPNSKSSEGNTIWKKLELELTILNYITKGVKPTQIDIDKVNDIIEVLLNSKTLELDQNHYFLKSVKMIDKNVTKAVFADCTLKLNMPKKDDLTEDQFGVLENIVMDNKKISILYGPGGTGKTYSIAKLMASNTHIKTLVVAPTNIAALELTKSLLNSKVDISKLIGGRVMSVDAYLCNRKFQEKVVELVICDESSMMSTYHASIFSCEFNKIIMMGDNVQLAPVGAGAPFTDIIDSELIKYNPLIKSMRSDNVDIANTLEKLRKQSSHLEVNKVIPLSKSRSKVNSAIGKDELLLQTDEAIRKVNILIDTVIQRKDYKWVAYHNHVVESLNRLILGIKYGRTEQHIYECGHHLALMSLMSKGEAEQYNRIREFPLNIVDYIGLELYWSGPTEKITNMYQICNSFPVTVLVNNKLEITTIKHTEGPGDSVAKIILDIQQFEKITKGEGELKMSYARTIHKSQGATYDKVAYIVRGEGWEVVNGYPKDVVDQSAAYTAISRAKTEAFTLSLYSMSNDSILVVPSSRRKTLLKRMLVQRIPR
jgi:hypothetical protein